MIEYVTREGEILKTSPKWRVQTSDRVTINGAAYYVYRTKDCKKYIKAYVIKELIDGLYCCESLKEPMPEKIDPIFNKCGHGEPLYNHAECIVFAHDRIHYIIKRLDIK